MEDYISTLLLITNHHVRLSYSVSFSRLIFSISSLLRIHHSYSIMHHAKSHIAAWHLSQLLLCKAKQGFFLLTGEEKLRRKFFYAYKMHPSIHPSIQWLLLPWTLEKQLNLQGGPGAWEDIKGPSQPTSPPTLMIIIHTPTLYMIPLVLMKHGWQVCRMDGWMNSLFLLTR